MKRFLLSILCLFPVFGCYGSDSAYQALRALGSQRGEAILNHVIEVDGLGGDPKPAVWKILLDDPAARGGVREIEMSGGQIISEHTPVRQYAGAGPVSVMDFQHLNLDSPGAFTVANQEAVRLGVSFERVDYTLHVSETAGIPVWVLRLLDPNHRVMQTVRISADRGVILHGVTANTVPPPPAGALPGDAVPPVTDVGPLPPRRPWRRMTRTTTASATRSTRLSITPAPISNNSSPATAILKSIMTKSTARRLRPRRYLFPTNNIAQCLTSSSCSPRSPSSAR